MCPLLLICLLTASILLPVHSTEDIAYMRAPNHLGPRTWRAGVDCLDQFIEIYFTQREQPTRSSNIIITIAINMSTPAAQIQERFLRRMNEAVSEVPIKRKLFQLRIVSDAIPYKAVKIRSRDLLLADYYVIVVDQVERLQFLMNGYVSKLRSWNAGARYLILFNNVQMHTRKQADSVSTQIFNYMMKDLYIHRVSVLYAINDTEYIFIGSDYFSNKACRQLRLRKIGTCLSGQLKPSKETVEQEMLQYIGNFTMQNCTINVCTSIGEPYVEKDCKTGLEMTLLKYITNRLQFQTNISCSDETRGVINPDGNWTGLLGMLENRVCDFIMGGFYPDNDVFESFWSSDCYMEESFTWFTKVAAERPPVLTLYSIFDNQTWLCIILMLFLSWFFLWLFINVLPELQAHRQFSLNGLNALALTICVSIAERPVHNTGRIFFMALTLYGINLITVYTSKLIQVFGDPGQLHQISTLDEAIESGIPFGGPEENEDWFNSVEDSWIQERYNFSPEFDVNFANLDAVKDGKRIILSGRKFVLQHPNADDLYGFPVNVFSSPIQMIMKSGFPFLLDLNIIIRRTRDAGIFQKINQDFEYYNKYLKRIAKMRPELKEQVIVLTTEHLEGAFALLLLGIILGSLIFAGELLVFYFVTPALERRRQKKRKIIKSTQQKYKSNHIKGRRKESAVFGDGTRSKRRKLSKIVRLRRRLLNEFDINEYKVQAVQDIRFTPSRKRNVFK